MADALKVKIDPSIRFKGQKGDSNHRWIKYMNQNMLTCNTSARDAFEIHFKKVKSPSIQFGACVNINVAEKTGLSIHKDLIWKPDRLLNYHRNIPEF